MPGCRDLGRLLANIFTNGQLVLQRSLKFYTDWILWEFSRKFSATFADMSDQWLTADRCSFSSFVPRLARAGQGREPGRENTTPALSQHLQCFISWQQSRAIWNIGAAASLASAAPENRYFIQNANLQLWKTNIGMGWWMGVYIESEIYLRWARSQWTREGNH